MAGTLVMQQISLGNIYNLLLIPDSLLISYIIKNLFGINFNNYNNEYCLGNKHNNQ